MPGRFAANFGGPTAGRRWPLVRNVLGASDLLQRDPDRLHHPEAAQAQQGSDGIQFRLQDGVQDDQEVGRRGALWEPVRRYVRHRVSPFSLLPSILRDLFLFP